jgi:hypothetical protein
METNSSLEIEKKSEETWNSLTQEQQLDVFCAVARRLYQGEIVDKGSFRYILYDIFKFGPEAYTPVYNAGYMMIHNAICDQKDYDDLIIKVKNFAEENNIDQKIIENYFKF